MRMRLLDPSNQKLYIICFICRSGSTYLCELLSRAGLGLPQEYYFPYEFATRAEKWHKLTPFYGPGLPNSATHNPAAYLDAIISIQQPVAGMKCTPKSLQCLSNESNELLQAIQPTYFYLTRRDKLQQAISWYRATATERWSSNDSTTKSDPPYSLPAITKYLDLITEHEQLAEELLANAAPIRLFYEDLSPHTVWRISDQLQVEPLRPWNTRVTLQIQRDNTTNEWATRYQRDLVAKELL
jgi:LPS sulfotransferase NodH